MSRAWRITPRAGRDIEAIADYRAAQNDLSRAEQFLNGIDLALRQIAHVSKLGEMNFG